MTSDRKQKLVIANLQRGNKASSFARVRRGVSFETINKNARNVEILVLTIIIAIKRSSRKKRRHEIMIKGIYSARLQRFPFLQLRVEIQFHNFTFTARKSLPASKLTSTVSEDKLSCFFEGLFVVTIILKKF